MKGASQTVSAVLITAVTLSAIGVVLNTAGPAIENARDAATIDRAVNFMNELDSSVRQVASEGEGSTRSYTLDFDRGYFYLNSTRDRFSYNLESQSEVISPQSRTMIGETELVSNAFVDVYKDTVDGEDCYAMENQVIKTCIKKIDEITDSEINTSNLVTKYKIKDSNELDLEPRIILNGVPSSSSGKGYTEASMIGERLGKGEVTAFIENSAGFRYRVVYELYAGADFISIRVLPEE